MKEKQRGDDHKLYCPTCKAGRNCMEHLMIRENDLQEQVTQLKADLATALNEADALRSVAIAMRDALATCDPDQFGIGGGKHEGDTAWYIRDELIARADAAIKPNAAAGEEGTE